MCHVDPRSSALVDLAGCLGSDVEANDQHADTTHGPILQSGQVVGP